MSAFVVGDATINLIVSFLATDRDGDWTRRLIQRETGCDLTTGEGRKKLGLAMFELNCRAVNQRYGEGEAAEFRALDYEFGLLPTSRMQAYKSLQCWHYQCAEGTVPDESLLYSTMQRVMSSIADDIVRRLPEYDAARWD